MAAVAMAYVADLHIHSSYARSTSPQLTLANLAAWARLKGIHLLATGDFTHPVWREELRTKLEEEPGGLFRLKGRPEDNVRFVLGTEVSCVYPQAGRTRRVHLLLFAPGFEAVERLCRALAPWGKLASDGRPTLGLSARGVVEVALEADPRCLVVPAHAWTPWYSVFGSKGGFDSLADCFGDMLLHITAVETGLSSDPAMNWRVPELDGMAIVSFSDAHSLANLGREATVLDGQPGYEGLRQALSSPDGVAYTVEFFPAEGKYHYDGHRRCGICQSPAETVRQGQRCPRCGRTLTLGVAYRLEALAAREEAVQAEDGFLTDPEGKRPPFRRLVPLREVLAEALGRGAGTKGVQSLFSRLVQEVEPELELLQRAPLERIASVAGERVAEGIGRVRRGQMTVQLGYDGVYGKVRIWGEGPPQLF